MDCLFVIDYQKDFVDGALGFPGAEKIDAAIAARVREYGPGRVWFTRDTHFDDYLSTREGRHLPVPHCIDKLTFGMDIADPEILAKLPKETPEHIELCGLVSNICVISNAVVLQGHYPNAQIVVDARLTDSFDRELQAKALDVLAGLHADIRNR